MSCGLVGSAEVKLAMQMRVGCVALVLAIAGCGRSGFDTVGAVDSRVDSRGADAGGDDTFVPSNPLPTDPLDEVTGVLDDASAFLTIDSDTGQITGSAATLRAAGVGLINGIRFETSATLGVLGLAGWTVPPSTTVRVFGSRALVVVVRDEVILAGTIDVSAGMCAGGNSNPTCGGPGGGLGSQALTVAATGCGPGGSATGGNEPGGGGGGMGEAGADGGSTPPGQGGAIAGCPPATLVPLAGGAGGGHGGGNADLIGAGGGGGGAIQLSSHVRIRIDGAGILAAGAGGRGGGGEGAGGGGAGGAILLEAPIVELVSGTLAANGGGGGEGNGDVPGEDGRFGATPAEGGLSGGGLAPGGAGGALGTPPTAGVVDATLSDGGGGGGGAGRIRVNAQTLDRGPAFITSPAETTGTW